MKPSSSKIENAQFSSLDSMLEELRHQTQHEPPPALREYLRIISKQHSNAQKPGALDSRQRAVRVRILALSAAATVACVLLPWLITRLLLPQRDASGIARIASNSAQPVPTHPAASAAKISSSTAPEAVHTETVISAAVANEAGNLIIPLPYSDRAVTTGTISTIPVSVSQNELLTLGVPVSSEEGHHRFVAELILGADGLPRALSVPFPLTTTGDME
ncbi:MULTISPECIES: hypothetical protein [Acidobacterium]|uniref:hypothetical protein n=1 Tax=Acidobacterium TaxID=33973 RepID=UPI0011D0F72D|nr:MULTISPECIES: hypothetical protein [Acidobacterium]